MGLSILISLYFSRTTFLPPYSPPPPLPIMISLNYMHDFSCMSTTIQFFLADFKTIFQYVVVSSKVIFRHSSLLTVPYSLVAKFIVAYWLDKVDYGIGLSYRRASLCSLTGRYDNPVL